MPEYVTQYLKIEDLSKGLNTFEPASRVPTGYYVDAQNMVFENKTPKTCGGLTKLTVTECPNLETVVWAEPYTTDEGVTELVVCSSAGTIYRYTPSTDDWETLHQGFDTDSLNWNHVPFRGKLVMTNGTDSIMKYDGVNIIPVGGLLVADMETDETWIGTFSRPGSRNFRLRRTLLSSVTIKSGKDAARVYTDPADFLTGIDGATDFGASDVFKMHVYKDPKHPNARIEIRFIDSTNVASEANRFTATTTITTSGWHEISILRSAFATTGSPTWDDIKRFKIRVLSGQQVTFDQAWWEYELKPPIGKYVELYQQQLIVAGIPDDPVLLQYSDPGSIDYFPAESTARFSGGRHALEKTDQITALRSYFDELIVGKVNSAWTFSGTGTNVSISALPLTLGIDGHRAVAETPWSLQYSFENNILGARLTSRGLVSTNISSLLADIDGNALEQIVTIRHDKTHTIRWSFKTLDSETQNDLGLIYDYQQDAWISKYSPAVRYYTRGIVDGRRVVIVVQYDGYVRYADTGTDFDGTAIESYITLPYMQSQAEDKKDKVVRWLDGTFYFKGTADVQIQARFADEPHEFETASFTTFGTVQATPDGDKGYVSFGRTARWMQLKFYAVSGSFEVLLPAVVGYSDTSRRV
jgi:hypothetical protein